MIDAPIDSIDVHGVLIIWYRVWHFDIPVWTFSLGYLVIEFAFAAIGGMHWGSEILHLMGAAVGCGLGIMLLKTGRVDCENWDVFSVLAGKHRKPLELTANKSNGDLESTLEIASGVDRDRKLQQVRQFVSEGQPRLAYQMCKQLSQKNRSWQLPQEDLAYLIDGLLKGEFWPEAIECMNQYIDRHPAQATDMRIKLAWTYLAKLNRPDQAQTVMSSVHASLLPPTQREMVEQLKEAIASHIS